MHEGPDEKTLEEWLFERKKAEVIFAVVEGEEVGLPCSSIISPLFLAGPVFTWKIFM